MKNASLSSWFHRLFPRPHFPGDMERTRLGALINDFFGVAIVIALANLAVTVPTAQFTSWANVAMTAFAVVGSLIALTFLRRGHLTAVALAGTLMLFAIGALGLYKVNTVHAMQMLALLTSAIFTTMVLGPRIGIAVMAAATLLVLGFAAVQAQGGLGPPRTPGPWSQWILFVTHGLLLFLLATLQRQHMIQAVAEEKALGDRVLELLGDVAKARASAEETAERYRSLFENMSEGIVVIQDEAIAFANPSVARLLDRPLEELVGLPVVPLVHPDDAARAVAYHAERIRSKAAIARSEFRILRAGGQPAWVQFSAVTISWKGRAATLAFLLDVSARRQLEDDLQRSLELATQARDRAEAASRTKSQFLANMSHEIRTPMNSVLGMAHLLGQTGLDARQRDYLDKIRISGEHLLGIIEDILDYSKIEAGKVELEIVPFSVADIGERISAIVGPRAAVKNLGFSVTLADDVPPVLYGDPLRLEQVLVNLLGNAVKFTEAGRVGARIGCLARRTEDTVLRFEVSDSGIGIGEDEADRLFKPFEQADASTTRRFGGTGLGLSISRRLVALMGGEIGVHSTPGAGSTFWFTVPFSERPVVSGLSGGRPAGRGYWTPLNAPDSLRGCRILLAEDNPFNLQVAMEMLAVTGATVVAAANGREAVERLQAEPFDCVLMDVQMPVMDGLAATRAIRALDDRASTRIIAMTANATEGDRRQCLEAGMDDFLTKPIVPDQLIRTLLSWIERRSPPEPVAAGSPSAREEDELLSGAALERLGHGDPQLVRRLAESFLVNLRQQRDELSRGAAENDLRLVALAAHRLKSSARWVGARALGSQCEQLEKFAQAGERDAAMRQLAELEPLLLEVEVVTEARLDRGETGPA